MELLTFKIILVVVLFTVSLGIAAYSTWGERKVAAILQDRIGPNRAGPFGILQPLADGGKLFFKEGFVPQGADRFLFYVGPALTMFISLITGAVIPWGKSLNIGGNSFDVQVANIDVGVLYLIGMVSIGVYGMMIGGWASNNKYSLIGAIRASSQMISYGNGPFPSFYYFNVRKFRSTFHHEFTGNWKTLGFHSSRWHELEYFLSTLSFHYLLHRRHG